MLLVYHSVLLMKRQVDEMLVHMLTTVDNPHSPFDNYPAWFAFDTAAGYHTPSLLGRVLQDSDQLSEADQALAIEQAIDEIVRENVTGMFRKVSKEVVEEE